MGSAGIGWLLKGVLILKRENLEWKPIEGYENQYEVSNYGDVHIKEYHYIDKAGRRWTRKERYVWVENMQKLGGNEKQGRYLGLSLSGMNKSKQYSHRLAAKAFIPNPENKPEVNHKDGNTQNNYCGCKENDYLDSNLEWVTSKENMEHASKNGLVNHESLLRKIACKKNREKIDYDKIRRTIYQMDLNGNILNKFNSVVEASIKTGIGKTTIFACAHKVGYHKTAGGYNWVYVDEYDKNKNYVISVDLGSGNRKAVQQYSLDGKFINEYKSVSEACRINGWTGIGYICECCKGKRKKYKNFIWKYKE